MADEPTPTAGPPPPPDGRGPRARGRVTVHPLRGLSDPALPPTDWRALLAAGDTREVFGTPEWLAAWRGWHRRGRLAPVLVCRAGRPVLLAPFLVDTGMVFLCGVGAADYLDLLGAVDDAPAVAAALAHARRAAPGFVGFRLHHVPEDSRTGASLRAVAGPLGLELVDEGTAAAPYVDLAVDAATARPAAHRRSLLRHERGLRRAGSLAVSHARALPADSALLDAFFDQHVARWSATPHPSPLADPACRAFYRAVVAAGSAHGWLVFTALYLDGAPIAFHLGFDYAGSLLWYKPSFDPRHAARSPGEVLLRQLLLLAGADAGCRRFDFGLGDEPFKYRFATGVRRVRTWGLYPVAGTGR
ncbi:MAG TPA: GNAT family N-acetyltransferase [Pilimelia sp.]|nr:GNAT family N-acetyltransferase [Pilimelia sp.]